MNSYFIPWICTQLMMTMSPQNNPACNSALNATVMQDVQLSSELAIIQNDINSEAQKVYNGIKDEVGMGVIVAAGAIYVFQYSRQIQFTVPAKPFSDTVSFNGNMQSASLNISWKF